jgi:hypothetical protein
MKALSLICILLLFATDLTKAQCAYQVYHRFFPISSTQFKIIEVSSGYTMAFCGVYRDTIDPQNSSNYDIGFVKTDSCGNIVIKKSFGYEDYTLDDFQDVIFTPDSNLLVLGHGQYTGQGGLYSATLFKMDQNGQILWKRAYGGSNGFAPLSLVYNPYRNTYIISGQIERIRTSGLWNRAYIMEIDTAGTMLNEKDIILNNDSLNAKGTNLKLERIDILKDSTLLGFLTGDTGYWVKFNSNLDILWLKQPVELFFSAHGAGMVSVGFDQATENTMVNVPAKQRSAAGRWISVIDHNGALVSSTFLSNALFSGGDGMGLTLDGGYLFWSDSLIKIDATYHTSFAKPLLGISDADKYYHRLKDAIQLKSGAYAGVGVSSYHSNNKYGELYIMQTHPNGGFVGIEPTQKTGSKIQLYPNPSNGIFTIQASTSEKCWVQVYDVSGKIICKQYFTGQLQLNLSSQAKGVYIVKVLDENGVIMHSSKVALGE